MLTRDCDLGIALDGDGDRIGVIDSEGEVLWGDQLMVVWAADVLATNPGATIIADVKASQSALRPVAATRRPASDVAHRSLAHQGENGGDRRPAVR